MSSKWIYLFLVLVVLASILPDNLLASKIMNSAKIECETRYHDFSSAPTFIKLRLRDMVSGKTENYIIENYDFAVFIMAELGFTRDSYIHYMTEYGQGILDVDIQRFVQSLEKRFGNKLLARKYLESRRYDRPFTLAELGLTKESDLLRKYFRYDEKKHVHMFTGNQEQNTNDINSKFDPFNPKFIALLIELGYNANRGDAVPYLTIIKRCVTN